MSASSSRGMATTSAKTQESACLTAGQVAHLQTKSQSWLSVPPLFPKTVKISPSIARLITWRNPFLSKQHFQLDKHVILRLTELLMAATELWLSKRRTLTYLYSTKEFWTTHLNSLLDLLKSIATMDGNQEQFSSLILGSWTPLSSWASRVLLLSQVKSLHFWCLY
jgi:hypothetical protein